MEEGGGAIAGVGRVIVARLSRAQSRSTQGLSHDVLRVGARCVRLHDPDVRPRQHSAKLFGQRCVGRALGTVTLVFRVLGGIGAGTAADRWGRKPPIMFSIAWFTAFAFLSGLSTSYVMLFAFRALFGIGMGGMWAAGVPLALEHLPIQLRGVASGLLQGGFSFGFMLSSLVYQFGWPLVMTTPTGAGDSCCGPGSCRHS